MRKAALSLNMSLRAAQKVILMVNKGWTSDSQASILSAVAYAESFGIKVLAVTFQSYQWLQDQYMQVSQQDPKNLVYRYYPSDLVTIDNTFPVAIMSRICVAQTNPCGSCCGQCEPTCGTCLSVTSCPVSTNCSFSYNLLGNATQCCYVNPTPSTCANIGTFFSYSFRNIIFSSL